MTTLTLRDLGFVAAGQTAIAWTPAQITTSIWLDAADASTITTVSGAVSQWNDKSGNGRNFLQSTAAKRPALTSSGLNGNAVITFDGANTSINCSTSSVAFTSQASFAVARFNVTNMTFGRIFTQTSGTTLDYSYSYIPLLVLNQNLISYMAGNAAQVAWSVNTPAIIQSVNNGSSVTNTVNATTSATSTTPTFNKSFDYFGIGQTAPLDPSAYFNGYLAELIVLPNSSSTQTIERIQGYLAWKWGLQGSLPSGHPYKNAAP